MHGWSLPADEKLDGGPQSGRDAEGFIGPGEDALGSPAVNGVQWDGRLTREPRPFSLLRAEKGLDIRPETAQS